MANWDTSRQASRRFNAGGGRTLFLFPLLGTTLLGCGASVRDAQSNVVGRTTEISHASLHGATSNPKERPLPLIPSKLRSLRSDGDADNPRDIDGNGDVDTVDADDDSHTPASRLFPDADDGEAFDFGKSAGSSERRAIASLVVRYYAAAHASNGKRACLLMGRAFASTIPASYGSHVGMPDARRGETCQSVMTQLFERTHRTIPSTIAVVVVRVEGDQAEVIFSSPTAPASEIETQRSGTASWRIVQTLGSPLP